MAFGQQSGPPASAKQVQELLSLLRDAGHLDFRDGRGPMGFTQRQAAGGFTREEAANFIERLLDEGPADEELQPDAPSPVPAQASDSEQALRRIPVELLAAEVRRRGWTVTEA